MKTSQECFGLTEKYPDYFSRRFLAAKQNPPSDENRAYSFGNVIKYESTKCLQAKKQYKLERHKLCQKYVFALPTHVLFINFARLIDKQTGSNSVLN